MSGWVHAGFRDIAYRAERLAAELTKDGAIKSRVWEADRIAAAARKYGFIDPRPHAKRNKQPASHGAGVSDA